MVIMWLYVAKYKLVFVLAFRKRQPIFDIEHPCLIKIGNCKQYIYTHSVIEVRIVRGIKSVLLVSIYCIIYRKSLQPLTFKINKKTSFSVPPHRETLDSKTYL